MDELIDIWDAAGQPTGRTALKSEAHRMGWFHPTVHIWFYTGSGRVLLQRRAADKETFPGLWDVSVAGHIGAGENPRAGAVREIQEEIGLGVSPSELEPIGTFKAVHEHPGGILDCEFHHIFLCRLQKPISHLVPQNSEVAELKLFPLITLAEELWGLARPGRYVPHSTEYYQKVFREIRSRL
jgi:isopentenyldiphosphate isomerase